MLLRASVIIRTIQMLKRVDLTRQQAHILREPVNYGRYPVPRGSVNIIEERCKECGYCWTYCPRDVLVKSESMNSGGYHPSMVAGGREEECVACRMCESVCPEFAIFIEEVSG